MPAISIIIPCKNAEHTISETLSSIQAQSFQDWEAICVDDGSIDQTPFVLHQMSKQDPRIVPVFKSGLGPSKARNTAAKKYASGEILAFCDADDLWCGTKLGEVSKIFEQVGVDGVYAQIGFFNKTPQDCRVRSKVRDGHLSVSDLLGENPVCTMSNFSVRREAFLSCRGFDETMVHNEDLEFLIRFVGSGKCIQGLNKLQVWYRTNHLGLSSDLGAMQHGRALALHSARKFGFEPDKNSEAIYFRYLARRALRLGTHPLAALRYTISGIALSPASFLWPVRRGAATALAALLSPILPRAIRRVLFIN